MDAPSLIRDFVPHPEIALTRDQFNPAVHKQVYFADYVRMFEICRNNPKEERGILRYACRNDLFFLVYFIMGNPIANHPFVVNQCRLVHYGPASHTVDIWARGHMKSSIITMAYTIRRILCNPESTTAIFSFKKPAADKFLDGIRKVLEMPFLVWLFPEILYEKADVMAPSWSLQGGIRVKRESASRRENTVESFGLIEGMPTGGHFDHRIYDDVETADLALNPDQLQLCYDRLEMSRNLGVDGGTEQIIGTYYSHCGVMVKLGDKKRIDGSPMYHVRVIPATDDGTASGRPVFLSQKSLDLLKMDASFNSQQLCNPTPLANLKLHFDRFVEIDRSELPKDRYKFVVIDPAGDKAVLKGTKTDSWAMLCVSVECGSGDDLGNSRVFLEDMIVGTMEISEAISAACNLYIRNGRIDMLGVENVSNTFHDYISKALKSRGVYLNLRKKGQYGGNFMLLSPMGRAKNYRIESALAWPLNNGKLHYVSDLSLSSKALLKQECDKFPFYHVDVLDALAYVYDIVADPVFDSVFVKREAVRSVTETMDKYSFVGAW